MTLAPRCYVVCLALGMLLGLAGCGDNPPPTPIVPTTPTVEPTIPKTIDDETAPPTAGAALPFSIELGEPFTIEGAPGLHSFAQASATVDGGTKWLFVGGRTGGLHGFVAPTRDQPDNAFAPADANLSLVVIDIENRTAKSVLIGTLAKLDPPLPPTVNTLA